MHRCSYRAIAIIALTSVGLGALAQHSGVEKPKYKVVSKKINPSADYKFSRLVHRGQLIKEKSGKSGTDKKTYTLHYSHGKVVSKHLIKDERVEPINAVYLMGRYGYTPSRHEFSRGRIMEMEATAYDPSPGSNGGYGGRTATGMRAEYGCIAVDPRVIPLGTLLYVEGYGFGIASDTGGAIHGHRIDLCYASAGQANNFGRRRVRVHILNNR